MMSMRKRSEWRLCRSFLFVRHAKTKKSWEETSAQTSTQVEHFLLLHSQFKSDGRKSFSPFWSLWCGICTKKRTQKNLMMMISPFFGIKRVIAKIHTQKVFSEGRKRGDSHNDDDQHRHHRREKHGAVIRMREEGIVMWRHDLTPHHDDVHQE